MKFAAIVLVATVAGLKLNAQEGSAHQAEAISHEKTEALEKLKAWEAEMDQAVANQHQLNKEDFDWGGMWNKGKASVNALKNIW